MDFLLSVQLHFTIDLKIKNFRAYQNEVRIDFDDLTAFVGKNDIGKSTILEALDIFFNDGKGAVKLDKQDINVHAVADGDNEIVLTVCFTDLPDHIVVDATNETTLLQEHLLNQDGELEVIKKYPNAGAAKVFIHAFHPTNQRCGDLLTIKQQDLRRRIQEDHLDCDNQNINAIMRATIWHHYANDLQLANVKIDASKEDAKKIWEKLATYLPVYALFQSDRKNTESDNEVQDPLKVAVNQILSDPMIQETLTQVATEVERKLRDVAERTLDKLREMNPEVANCLNPVIPTAKWQDVFKNVSITGDENIPLNKRGSGVKRLVLLNFFRAEAERRSQNNTSDGIIYAFEEPETSQHGDNQRLLVNAFKELSSAHETQVILTTHSSIVIKNLDLCNLRIILDNGERKEIHNADRSVLQYRSLNEVSYIAFGDISEEYHNELYGFIDIKGWWREYDSSISNTYNLYIRDDHGRRIEQQKSLTERIRHQIHHPENTLNAHFTQAELADSIRLMRLFIASKIDT